MQGKTITNFFTVLEVKAKRWFGKLSVVKFTVNEFTFKMVLAIENGVSEIVPEFISDSSPCIWQKEAQDRLSSKPSKKHNFDRLNTIAEMKKINFN